MENCSNEQGICTICNKRYDNYNYSYFIEEFDKDTIEVCPKCMTEKERKSNYYFRNYLPTFVAGDIKTIIFKNKKELEDYILSLKKNHICTICILSEQGKNEDTIIKIYNDKDLPPRYTVLGRCYSKTKLDLPKFEDIKEIP